MPIFALAVFLSSVLLFAVQPMIAKFLLPSFGGTAAVWATCLVVFQTLLLAGYAYAHWLRAALSPRAQRWTHAAILILALLFLPPHPAISQRLIAGGAPVWELLRSLLTSIGLPFFALSATAPLLMEWFRQVFPDRSPDRLYAFSNAGSLLALLSYPFLLEPAFARSTQARLWGAGFILFLGLCLLLAWRLGRLRAALSTTPFSNESSTPSLFGSVEEMHAITAPAKSDTSNTPNAPPLSKGEGRSEGEMPTRVSAPGRALRSQAHASTRLPVAGTFWLWIALPACGSALLLAITNQISQDVAPIPLLWVAPLSVYLLTFILCFEGPRSYIRGFFIPSGFTALLLLAWLLDEGYLQSFAVQVGGYLAVLFFCCMVCHGELYRIRPTAERLTFYYLCISLGGAVGGMFVGLLAPAIFRTLLETPIIAVGIVFLVTLILWREWRAAGLAISQIKKPQTGGAKNRRAQPASAWPFALSPGVVAGVGTTIIVGALAYVVVDLHAQSIYFTRNFYGAYRVKQGPTLLLNKIHYPLAPGPARVLLSGQIYHGLQFLDASAASIPTTYYCEEGGLGLAFRGLASRTNRNIGAVGLGAGTLAAYGQRGDHIRFYELNPDVLRIAQSYFTYLTNSAAQVDVVLGDGRLTLEREPSESFDLLVLDAFSGDSIPMHLLTAEAMAIYQRHLKPDGVMAFHISNSHLDLEPVVRALADRCGMTAALVPARFLDARAGKLASIWMLLSANGNFFNQPGLAELTTSLPAGRRQLLWTDDHSSILPILH